MYDTTTTPPKLTIFRTTENYTERKVYIIMAMPMGRVHTRILGGFAQSSPYCISFAILTQHA